MNPRRMDVTERVGQPFEESADEASPSTVTALLVGGLPRGIVLPPALFEVADPTITGSRRKHSHEETSVYRKSAGRHDTIVGPANPGLSAAELYRNNLKSAEMDGHNLEARRSTTYSSLQSTAPAPLAVQLVLPGERTTQPTRPSDSRPSSLSSQSSEPRRSSRWAEKVASRAAQAAKAEATRAAKPASGSMEALHVTWNRWLGVPAREAVRTFYGR